MGECYVLKFSGHDTEGTTETDEQRYQRLNNEPIPDNLWNMIPQHGKYIVNIMKFCGYQTRNSIVKLKEKDEVKKKC